MPIPIDSPEAIAIIKGVEKSLVSMALYDIHRSLRRFPPASFVTRKTKLVGGRDAIASCFILGCCLIEAAGHFLIQPPPPPTAKATGGWQKPPGKSQEAFEAFCDNFLTGYNGKILYKATRCGLAHSYSTVSNDPNLLEAYWLTHNEAAAHLQADTGDSRIRYINAQNFIADLHEAVSNFFAAARSNRPLRNGSLTQRTFLDWAEYSGLMAVTIDAGVATSAISTKGHWNGITADPIALPLAGIGSKLIPATRAPASALSTISVEASGWCGIADLGATAGYCIVTNFSQSGKVNLPPGFLSLERRNATGKPKKKVRGRKQSKFK